MSTFLERYYAKKRKKEIKKAAAPFVEPERMPTVTLGAMQRAEKTVVPRRRGRGVEGTWPLYIPPKEIIPKEVTDIEKTVRRISKKGVKELKRDLPEMEKIVKAYPDASHYILPKMKESGIPITLKNAHKVWKKYGKKFKRSEKYKIWKQSFITGTTGLGLPAATRLQQEVLKIEPPRTPQGKKIAQWTDFTASMLSPLSVYRLTPGGKTIKGLQKLRVTKLIDYALRRTVSPKLLPHAYRIVGGAVKGGINLPVLSLVNSLAETARDPKYKKKIFSEMKKSILPGVVLGGVLPEVIRGAKGIVTKLFKNDYQYRQLFPVEWATKKLKIRSSSDMSSAKKNYASAVRDYRTGLQTDKQVNEIRKQSEAYRILGSINNTKTKLIPFKEIRLTPEAQAEQYKRVKDLAIGRKDIGLFQNDIRTRNNQKELLRIMRKKKVDAQVRQYDEAAKIYTDTDLKKDPGAINRNWNKLSNDQQATVILSQNLPPKVKQLAKKIAAQDLRIGKLGVTADIIKNTQDNFVNRLWDPESFGKAKKVPEHMRTFGTKTYHRYKRKLPTILDGWAVGGKLKVKGLTESSKILHEEFIRTIEDKKFLNMMRGLVTSDGRPLASTIKFDDYRKIEHPNMTVWTKIDTVTRAGKAKVKAARLYGSQNVFKKTAHKVNKKTGNLMYLKSGKPKLETIYFERQNLYAPEGYARNLNDIFGTSYLMKFKAIAGLTKYNAWLKATTLQSGFFHHWAFGRSYWLPTDRRWGEGNPFKMYKAGIKAIETSHPMLKYMVKEGGLTLGLKQEWSEELLQEKTAIGKWLDKNKVSKKIKDKILDLRQKHVNFLFGEFGAGLKAKGALSTLRELQGKYPYASLKTVATLASNLLNDDFGGLHLKRIGGIKIAGIRMGGRNPTIQHVFRLLCLAPDWTESNLRTMVKAIKGGHERALYQKFWGRIFLRGMVLNTVANISFHGEDTIDAYRRMVEEYGLPGFFLTDITPIYEALGGKSGNRKYFAPLGHFLDPAKFVLHPIRTARYKASKVSGIGIEALTGRDWAERIYTTLPELAGFDYEKGVYKTTKKGYHVEGEPKYGKLRGKTVAWGFRGGAIEKTQLPSFLFNQTYRSLPVPAQNLIAMFIGELDAFTAIANMAGLQIKTTFGGKEAALKKGFTMVGDKDIIDIFQMERIKPSVAPKVKKEKKKKIIIKKKKKVVPYQKYLDMGYSDYMAEQLYKMTPRQRLEKLRKLKRTKLLKAAMGKFERELYEQKEIPPEEMERFTKLTNEYKLREKGLTKHVKEQLLEKKGKEYLDYLDKHLKKGGK